MGANPHTNGGLLLRDLRTPDFRDYAVEVKAPGKVPRPQQKARLRLLTGLGFKTYVLDDISQIGGILDEIQSS